MNYHSNYDINENYEDYNYINNNVKNNKQRFNGKTILIIVSILVFLTITALICITNYKNSYQYLEKQLSNSAKIYLENNKISFSNNYYFSSDKLNVHLKNNCKSISGVFIFNDGTYKPYLKCDNYESSIFNNKDADIALKGPSVIFINEKDEYHELGYSGTNYVKIINKVGTEPGVYEVLYNSIKNNQITSTLKRIVVITNDFSLNKMYPSILLEGNETITLNVNDNYLEPGFRANDSIDGDITNNVVIDSNLKSNVIGKYTIDYIITNSSGFTSYATRNIIVNDNSLNDFKVYYYVTPNNIVKDKKTITLYIVGNDYDYVLCPDLKKIKAETFTYDVNKNGTYSFKIYNKDGTFKIENILVSGIDNDLPMGTCSAITHNTTTTVSVTASDNNGISSYEYIINGNTFNSLSSTYNSLIGDAKTVNVNIFDLAGNNNNITCKIESKVSYKQSIIINNKKQNITCGNGPKYNDQLFKYVKDAGYKTREGAVAAAIYLASTLQYKIPYFWSGGHYHQYYLQSGQLIKPDIGNSFIGINENIGCKTKMAYGGTSKQPNGKYFPYGLDCSGFVAWALINGGYYTGDLKQEIMISTQNYNANIGGINNDTVSVSNAKGRIKPGDIAYKNGHVAFVIGVYNDYFLIAEEKGADYGLQITKQEYNNNRFTKIILMDNFYQNYKKGLPLWTEFK